MIVVAGVGNILRGDDGFGPAVVDAMRAVGVPDGVRLIDAGIRTMHLAYELAEGIDLFVAVDTLAGTDPPGTVVVLEPSFEDVDELGNGHGMDLHQVWELTRRLGPGPACTLLVGCIPGDLGDRMGLTPPVEAAVATASTIVREHIDEAVPR